jgi:hypothetical protein
MIEPMTKQATADGNTARRRPYAPFRALTRALGGTAPFRLAVLEESRWVRYLDALGRPLGVRLTGFDAFTWNGTVYLARRLLDTRAGYLVLRHEAVHLLDQRRLGLAPFLIGYLLLPLPLGLTLRALFEWRGYRETLRAYRERDPKLARRRAASIARQFTSGRYLHMWFFGRGVRRWIDRELDRLEQTDGRAPRGLQALDELSRQAPQGEGGLEVPGPDSIID